MKKAWTINGHEMERINEASFDPKTGLTYTLTNCDHDILPYCVKTSNEDGKVIDTLYMMTIWQGRKAVKELLAGKM